MTVSFNWLRLRIARTYNLVATAETPSERKDAMDRLREAIGALLSCYDNSVAGDCDDLSAMIELEEA